MARGLRGELIRIRMESPPGRYPVLLAKRLIKITAAFLLGATGATGYLLARLLRTRGMALVLGYHGVTEQAFDQLDDGHHRSRLEGQLRFLVRRLRPVPLAEIVGPIARGEAPPAGTFAVTFDDGLVNNLRLAVPMLGRLGIPATFFVPSALVGSDRDLWVLSLREMIRRWPQPAVPAEPSLWPELSLVDSARRYAAFCIIKEALKSRESIREATLARLAAGVGPGTRPPEPDRVMGAAELRRLSSAGFSIGAHSRHHPILSGLEEGSAREEVEGSRRELEALLGSPVVDFAYPNGRFADVSETARRLVEEAGYRCAVLTEPGMVRQGDDPLALRRCMPDDVPAFLAGFDLLIRAWKDRGRPGDSAHPIGGRISFLSSRPKERPA